METKLVLEDKLSIGGKELREIYEVVNHEKAFTYIQKCVAEGKPLDEGTVKDIHELLMENIFQGGVYRNVDVQITGAAHRPPSPDRMYIEIKNFYADLQDKSDLNPIELAAWTHAEFVKIHPFTDGNGRTSRPLIRCWRKYRLGNIKNHSGMIFTLPQGCGALRRVNKDVITPLQYQRKL